MGCRGVFFALTSAQKDRLLELGSDDKRLRYIQEEIEGNWDEAHLLETDKAWDAMHRCLTDGTLTAGRSSRPLGKLILGGVQLYSNPDRYIINLIESNELPEVSTALNAITKEWFKQKYEGLKNTDYLWELVADEDWEFTWERFSELPDFVGRAVQEGRSLIFTVDQ